MHLSRRGLAAKLRWQREFYLRPERRQQPPGGQPGYRPAGPTGGM